jgi:hypothetical protein
MTISERTAVLMAVLLAVPTGVAADAGKTAKKTTDGPALIKDAIVAGAALQALHPELADDDRASKQVWKLSRLVVAFDPLNSPDGLRRLVSLASYYLGEATNGLYECVLVRKGARVKTLLNELAASGQNECETVLLPQLGERPAGSPRVCLSTKETHDRISAVLTRMTKHERCDLEQ